MSSADTKQSKGGRVRAAKLSPEERRDIALRAAQARWAKLEPGELPSASHQGQLSIGDVEIEVYRLNDGRRLISKKAMAKALNLKSEGGSAFLRTITRKGVQSVISEALQTKIDNPIVFRLVDGDLPDSAAGTADGYEATTLIEVCDALIQARNEDRLAPSQAFLAVQAEIIIRSAAKVGIAALIDEATGYIDDKFRDEYRQLFQTFIKDEFRQWEKECPDKLFDAIYRLYGLKRKNPKSFKHPGFFGHFIRKYIYHALANSNGAILELLDEKNPVVYAGGGRKFKFHQFLTDEVGLPAFRQHLWQVIGIAGASTDKTQFERAFYRAFPEAIPKGNPDQLEFDLLEGR